jgi:hypothetical protein
MTAASTPLETVFDVWNDGSGTQFYTGSFEPYVVSPSAVAPADEYFLTITNLRQSYRNDETARFRIYTRQKDWSPTIYTKAVATPEVQVIESGSYEIYRVIDDLKVVSYGTGSDNQTVMSYDASGSYFDLDMSMFETGYSYGIKLSFYNQDIGAWVEQPETFKFKVESRQNK